MNLTFEQASRAIRAAKDKAQELDVKMNIALVDGGANLTAFARMDGAWLGSIDIAIHKAKTARYFMGTPCPTLDTYSSLFKKLIWREGKNRTIYAHPAACLATFMMTLFEAEFSNQ